MLWSTRFGTTSGNEGKAICASDSKIWMVGMTGHFWTLLDYDDTSDADYFLDLTQNVQAKAATIARFDKELTVGLPDIPFKDKQQINSYPNPFADLIRVVAFDIPSHEQIEVRVFDSLGKLLIDEKIIFNKQFDFDFGDLSKGNYVVQLRSSQGVSYAKIVKM